MVSASAHTAQLAERLLRAEKERVEVKQLTDELPELTVADAYRIQRELVRLKQTAGQRLIGFKMGLTSRAKQKSMGVDVPIYGHLFEETALDDGAAVPLDQLIHPRAEAELAFLIGAELSGEHVTAASVSAAVESVVPVIEIIDSRYRDFKFTLPDVIADNTSASRVVIGRRRARVSEVDLRLTGVVLEKNGEVVATGAAAAVLGNPLESIALLVQLLARDSSGLERGQLVLAGAITEAIPVQRGDVVSAAFDRLGAVTVSFC